MDVSLGILNQVICLRKINPRTTTKNKIKYSSYSYNFINYLAKKYTHITETYWQGNLKEEQGERWRIGKGEEEEKQENKKKKGHGNKMATFVFPSSKSGEDTCDKQSKKDHHNLMGGAWGFSSVALRLPHNASS